jgi:hypothetical protein
VGPPAAIKCIEGGIEGGDLIGSWLIHFPHNVHGDAAAIGQGDFHLVGTHVKVVAEGGFDQ